MPRKFPTPYGYVPIHPRKVESKNISDIRGGRFFQLEAGAIFGNCLVDRLNSELGRNFKIVHFDPGAITDYSGQALYSLIYEDRVKRLPLLGIKYGEKKYILITHEHHPNDGVKITGAIDDEMRKRLEGILADLNSQSKKKFPFEYTS